MTDSVRPTAVAEAKRLVALEPVFLDTETTGVTFPEIVELAIVDFDGTVLFDGFLKPVARIPAGATEVHGITNRMVAEAPTFEEVLPELSAMLSGRHVATYNRQFDARAFKCSAQAHEIDLQPDLDRWWCIMTLYSRFYKEWNRYKGDWKWKKLEEAALQCGIEMPDNLHRAVADTELARRLLLHIASREE